MALSGIVCKTKVSGKKREFCIHHLYIVLVLTVISVTISE